MQLYPWAGYPDVQDSGHQGPEELFIQPLCPLRANVIAAYPVS